MGLGLINPLISFVLIPIHIKFFSPSEYGMIYLLFSIATLSVMLSSLNLNAALKTFFFDYSEDTRRGFLSQLVSSLFIFGLLYLGLFLLLGPSVIDRFFDHSKLSYSYLIPLSIAAFILRNIVSSYQIYYRNARENKLLSFSSLTNSISYLILQLLFIVVLKWGVESVFIAMLISNFLALLIIWIIEVKPSVEKLKFEKIKKPIKYGLSLMPLFMMEWIMVRGDRLIVQDRFDLEELGLYALTMNIAIVISFITTSFLNAARPELYASFRAIREQGSKSNLYSLYGLFIGLLVITSIGLYILGVFLSSYADHDKYKMILQFLPLGIAILFIRSHIRLLYEYFECFKKAKPIVFLTSINLMIFLGLIFVIPLQDGIKGIFLALLFSNLVCLIFTFMFATLKQNRSIH